MGWKKGDPMDLKWYNEGLHFNCTGCGKCCTGSPGYVWINEEESIKLADHLKISLDQFYKTYTRLCYGKRTLKELKPSYDCIFFKDKKCTVYDLRPSQCKTFPFWDENMASKQSWDDLVDYCEGINREEGNRIPFEKIEQELGNNL
jgi:Fe-S-cluster containining protein